MVINDVAINNNNKEYSKHLGYYTSRVNSPRIHIYLLTGDDIQIIGMREAPVGQFGWLA